MRRPQERPPSAPRRGRTLVSSAAKDRPYRGSRTPAQAVENVAGTARLGDSKRPRTYLAMAINLAPVASRQTRLILNRLEEAQRRGSHVLHVRASRSANSHPVRCREPCGQHASLVPFYISFSRPGISSQLDELVVGGVERFVGAGGGGGGADQLAAAEGVVDLEEVALVGALLADGAGGPALVGLVAVAQAVLAALGLQVVRQLREAGA